MIIINNKYLNKYNLSFISDELKDNKPISYYVIDDFLDDTFYKKVEKELSTYKGVFNKIDFISNSFISNKSVLINTPNFLKLYNFFLSTNFEKVLQFIFKTPIKKYRKIDSDFIEKETGIKNSGVAQIYEKGDFMGWHTDISKDMKREELIEKGSYDKWNEYFVSNFDEIGAFIYYVYNSNNKWEEKNGGVLELGEYSNGEIKPFEKIYPKRNRLVLIKSSNISYHRVTEILDKGSFRLTIQDLLFDKNSEIGQEKMF